MRLFGWPKRKLRKQRRQLAYQNYVASTDMEMPPACLMKGGTDLRDQYENCAATASRLIIVIAKGVSPLPDLVDTSLADNKEMRRLYDLFGRTGRGEFDAVYRPLGGWALYFERCDDETHLIDDQAPL